VIKELIKGKGAVARPGQTVSVQYVGVLYRNGKQFDLAGFVAAPPCQPTFGGGDNGGATYPGVTKNQVTVVYYRVKDNPAITAALGNTGIVPSTAQLVDYLAAEQSFINSHYELWGRKVKIQQYQSPSCAGSPPSDDCFRQDARAVISMFHPFAVIFPQNGTTPGFQDELSKAGITVDIQVEEFGQILTEAESHKFDAALVGWSGRIDPDGNTYAWFHTGGSFNDGQYSNPQVDSLLDQARAASDQGMRKTLYDQAQQMLVQDVAYVFIDHGPAQEITSRPNRPPEM